MNIFHRKRISKYTIIYGILALLLISVIYLRIGLNDLTDRKATLLKIKETIKNFSTTIACIQPDLPINSSELKVFLKYVAPINCAKDGASWVTCEKFDCTVKEEISYQKGPIKCSFTDVLRVNDYENTDGETMSSDSYYKLEKSDVVSVQCYTYEDKWSTILTSIRYDKKILDRSGWEYVPKSAMKLNVLIFGFDSLSRNTFIRKLPKTYRYMTEKLGSLVLKGYNIVGDGTPQALTPILTGKSELELPETRKRIYKSNYVDVYPFIWNDFKSNGYVTGFFEDMPTTGIYTYRLKGFKDQPTDHYMRPYYISASKYQRKWSKYCYGNTPSHQIMLNQIKNFFRVYKHRPKFLFGFHGELSHDDYNLIGIADDDVLNFLKYMHEANYLNNTIFIFMADHGHRFAEIRNTLQGKLEERLPFFSFTFPPWFKHVYKDLYQNFVENLNILTTPYDIYSTLKQVLNVDQTDDIMNVSRRSISLFTKLPKNRSCVDAFIEPHWCACLEWINIKLNEPIVSRLTNVLIETLNNYTQTHRNMCALLKLSDIYWVNKLTPNNNLIKYKKNSDIDGFQADLSAKMNIKSDSYQIKVKLIPGNSLFEASITHNLKDNSLNLRISDISRINMYGVQAKCVEEKFPHLRKYCFCLL